MCTLRCLVSAVAMLLLPALASAQYTVSLSSSTNREIWQGETAGSGFGTYLDRGDLSGDGVRDLIVGAPGYGSNQGRVYVVFRGTVRGGTVPATDADMIFTGGTSGDSFGAATAAGWITSQEAAVPQLARDLVIGAPNANGGAGAVYVFSRANFTDGARFSASNATLTIIGAPGDHLGTALATGDLDGDGYREIIMGAPGSNRVYAVKGGPSISGTVNLGTQTALVTMTGPSGAGIGTVLAAGDIMSDSTYDVAIGAPNLSPAGAVYVVAGHADGSIASTIDLASGADVVFTGIDPGDHAGASLTIGPFDADARWDLIIGAPDAAGPGNSRSEGGEVYAIWGSNSLTSRSLSNADLTIFGAASGYRTGAAVALGDVDRNSIWDLAMLAPGASGVGEIHVVLGRARSMFPAAIDLATNTDRRVIGDPAAGQIQSIIVYDHTGEGAEDILAGIPGAASGAGMVYISFSPLPEAVMSYPVNGQAIGGTNVPFQWSPAATVSAYRLTIGTSSGGNNVFDTGQVSASTTSYPMPGSLPYGQTVYARIWTNVAGTWHYSDSTFSVLAPPAFSYPTDHLSGVQPTNFSWSAVASNSTYELKIGSTAGAGDIIDAASLSAATYRVFSLPPGQTLYATVVATTGSTFESTTISFTTAPTITSASADSPGRGIGVNFGAGPGGDAFLYNPSSGTWSMQFSENGTFVGVNSAVWASNWTIQPGDFNGDGLTDLFLYNSTNGKWFKALNMGGGTFTYIGGTWAPGWNVTVIDFDGDGRSDVFLYNPTNGHWFRCMTVGDGDFAYYGGTWAPHWTIYPADFNGDGHGDLFLYNHSGDANSGLWFRVITQPDGSFSYQQESMRWASTWTIIPGDFNGDGRTDLFLYNANPSPDPNSGRWFRVITGQDGTFTYLPGDVRWTSTWTIHKADFNGDGVADLFLYNTSTGKWFQVITERDGSLSYYGGTWAANWNISVTDFDSDGHSDLLLYNSSSGQWFQATSTGLGSFNFVTGNWGTGWSVVGGRTILP